MKTYLHLSTYHSKMMGHSNITTTQGYAEITEDKISREMDKLIEKRSKTNNNVTV